MSPKQGESADGGGKPMDSSTSSILSSALWELDGLSSSLPIQDTHSVLSDEPDVLGDASPIATPSMTRQGSSDSVGSVSGKKGSTSYLAWLSNRQAMRQSIHAGRSSTDSLRESSPSTMHPYSRPIRKQDRFQPRPYGNALYSLSSQDGFSSGSPEFLSSLTSSPNWSRMRKYSDSEGEQPNDNDPDAIPSHPAPALQWLLSAPGSLPQRREIISRIGRSNSLHAEPSQRVSTFNESHTMSGPHSASAMPCRPTDNPRQINIQSLSGRSQFSGHSTINAQSQTLPGHLSRLGSQNSLDGYFPPNSNFLSGPESSTSPSTEYASHPGDEKQRRGSFRSNQSSHLEETKGNSFRDPLQCPPSECSSVKEPQSNFISSDASHKGSISPSNSADLRNAYNAMTMSLQDGSFDWAQSPNSNESYSLPEGNCSGHSNIRTNDITMSWLQRGLPRTNSVGAWQNEVDSEDNLDLLAEDMVQSRDGSPIHYRSSMSTLGCGPPTDAFEVGERIGPGLYHDGQLIRVAETSEGLAAEQDPGYLDKQLQVDKLIGYGSYAVVYLVHEVPDSERTSPNARYADSGMLESSTPGTSAKDSNAYAGKTPVPNFSGHLQSDSSDKESLPRQFALKCLSKQNLSQEMLDLQRIEARIHQSIPKHPNITTLHCVYETSDWLFLVLEYCPGQDLYYWLEEANLDHAPRELCEAENSLYTSLSEHQQIPVVRRDGENIPFSAWLLTQSSPNTLFTEQRLNFVAIIFHQMCEAVQFCHSRGISHRDIKPENFIVADLHTEISTRPAPKALVKLTDFGLATIKAQCDDFNCGSKPYMAFECRHNLADTYDPKQADIWSLGIVLLNLLFHRSPFKEPSVEYCSSFSAFSCRPILFLTEAFDGLPEEVAQFLCDHVFRDVSQGRAKRISAQEFGEWALQLPQLLKKQSAELNRELRGACSLTTSPLPSRSPSFQKPPESRPHSPPLDRQALSNSWFHRSESELGPLSEQHT